jgi:hypothetical protein
VVTNPDFFEEDELDRTPELRPPMPYFVERPRRTGRMQREHAPGIPEEEMTPQAGTSRETGTPSREIEAPRATTRASARASTRRDLLTTPPRALVNKGVCSTIHPTFYIGAPSEILSGQAYSRTSLYPRRMSLPGDPVPGQPKAWRPTETRRVGVRGVGEVHPQGSTVPWRSGPVPLPGLLHPRDLVTSSGLSAPL